MDIFACVVHPIAFLLNARNVFINNLNSQFMYYNGPFVVYVESPCRYNTFDGLISVMHIIFKIQKTNDIHWKNRYKKKNTEGQFKCTAIYVDNAELNEKRRTASSSSVRVAHMTAISQ